MLLFAGSWPSSALDPNKTLTQYAHRIWGQEVGLFQPTIYSILQTRNGFLWLGTQDSLIRFDGVHFREFDAAANATFHRSLIRSLVEDGSGKLWVGSIGAGLARISGDGLLTRFSRKDGLPDDAIFCLDNDASGRIWACTREGLARFENGRFHTFTTADGLPSNQVRNTCESPDGVRWVTGLDFGLTRLKGSRFETYRNPGLPAKETVTALACGKDGSIWLGANDGLKQIQGNTIRSVTSANGLPDNAVSAIAQSPDGSIWVGTDKGVSRYRNGDISVYRTRDGLSHSQVLSLFFDREGSLWAGTKDGLDQFTNGTVTPYTTNEGLLSNDVGPVLQDGAGRLWIGTLGRGLNCFFGNKFQSLTTQSGLADNTVLSLENGVGGTLWVGTKNGLNLVRDGRIVRTCGRKDGLSGTEIRALFSDAEGQLWVGTDRGLDKLVGERFTTAGVNPSLVSSGVVSVGGATAARLFVSTQAPAFFSVQKNEITTHALDVTRPVDCFYLDRTRHSAWMGTLGSGLLRWHNGALSHIWVKDGLYDNRIYAMVPDDKDNLWMASSKGIFRVGQQELEDFADGKIHSVNSMPFTTGQLRFECQSGVQPAASRTADGRLWFSTTNGLVVVDPNHLASNRIPPPAEITAVVVNGQRSRTFGDLKLQPWLHNVVEIRYAGLSFVSPEKVSFRYILDGYDRTWTDAGTRREAFFTNLPPGAFSFRVIARNADGVWGSRPAMLRFIVEPRFYQHIWFFPLLIALAAAAVAAWYRMRVRQLQRGFDLVLAERSRIARELHDTLLQGLSGVTMQLQALWTRLPVSREKSTLSEIIADAGKASREARQSIWGLRESGAEPVGFVERIEKLVREAPASHSIALSLRFGSVPQHLPPEMAYQLLRIIREAVANALRHADARRLTLSVFGSAGEIRILIEDDGVGFSTDPKEQRFGHFGLIGMRERADEIDAELTVISKPGQGTIVSIQVPIANRTSPESNPAATVEHHLR